MLRLRLTRRLLPILLGGLLLLVFVTPVMAIEPPDDLEISGVWVYRNCREDGDQLYLAYYSINYTTAPAEDTSEAYLCRLMNEAVELRSIAPFAYHDDGYGEGVAAIYFNEDDAPTWSGNYTMRLMGNPFLSWNGTIPQTSYTDFDIWQDNELFVTHTVLASRIIELANDLETAWGVDMVTSSDEGDDILTSYALGYFLNVIPYLGDMAQSIFPSGTTSGSGVITPEVPEEWERTDYADSLVDDIIGTPFDLTEMSTAFGVSRGSLTAILYYGCVILALVLFVRRIGSYKPIMMFSIPMVILGAFVGVPLIVTILAGLAALAMTAFTIFYKPSSA